MKKNALTIILALVAVAALIFGFVANGGKGDLQTKLDDATAQLTKVQDELNAKIESLNGELDSAKQAAEDAAKTAEEEIAKVKAEAEEAVANAKAEAEKAVADAKAEAEKAIEEAKNAAAQTAENVTEAVENVTENVTEAVEGTVEAVTETAEAPAVMSHADYIAAELDSEVTVETYVQAKQSWWSDKATIYCQSEDGAYFIYELPISEADYDALVPGTKIRVTGYKSAWSGEVEITDATYEVIEGEAFIATATDVTDLLDKDELIDHQNELVAFKGMTVEDYGDGAAFAYKNANDKTDDLYFKVSKDGKTYDFCVEFYLCGQDTDVYKAVEALNVGDVIDLEGFLYWYNGLNPHITAISAAQ